jgi:hypothetical protein
MKPGQAPQILSALGRQLEGRYGRGFGEKSLRHMVGLVEAFPDVLGSRRCKSANLIAQCLAPVAPLGPCQLCRHGGQYE